MSNDTQVKQEDKVPARVWLSVFEDDQDPQSAMLEWRSPVVRNTQPGDYVATRPHHKIAYVPESLLTTVRKEEREAAFNMLCHDCAEGDVPILDRQLRWFYHRWDDEQVGCSASKLRIAALEASATEEEGMNG